MTGFRYWLKLTEANQVLDEMPVSVNLVGDHTPGAFRQDDITLATNPKAQAKREKIWHTSVVDVDLYLLNSPGDNAKHRYDLLDRSEKHAGNVPPSVLKRRFGLDIKPRRDAITVVFTQNEGSERVPLTGWMIAHRICHIFLDGARNDKLIGGARSPNIGKTVESLDQIRFALQDLARKSYTIDAENDRLRRNELIDIISAIGTTKAFRDANLSSAGEIIPEAFAQYILTGTVRFNSAPSSVEVSYYSEKHTAVVRNQASLDRLNQTIETMRSMYMSVFAAIIAFAKGKIFIL